MNEIERAVAHYRYGITHDIFSEPVTTYAKLAVEALREQAERSKGCEFCCYTEYPDEKLYPKEGYAFYAGFSKQVDVDAFDEGEVEKISYCPMCGRKLEEAPSDWTKNKACRDAVLKTFGGRA
jgi:hypothetical protein